MKPIKAALLGACLLLGTATAWAGDADVCYSHAEPPGNTSRLKDTTPLVCGHAGTHSLAELAKAGWSVVVVRPDEEMTTRAVSLPGPSPRSIAMPTPDGESWMVVIQKQP